MAPLKVGSLRLTPCAARALQITINVPLTDKTRGMFNKEVFAKMKVGEEAGTCEEPWQHLQAGKGNEQCSAGVWAAERVKMMMEGDTVHNCSTIMRNLVLTWRQVLVPAWLHAGLQTVCCCGMAPACHSHSGDAESAAPLMCRTGAIW